MDETPNPTAQPKKKRFLLGLSEGENPHFKLYCTVATGVALGIFPLGGLTIVALLAWVFLRQFHILSLAIAVAVYIGVHFLGIPPLHPVGALVLDNGPQGLFIALGTSPLFSVFRLHEYETMGAFVILAVAKVLALIASKRVAARYWPHFEGPSFAASKHFSIKALVLLPLSVLVLATLTLLAAPIFAKSAVKETLAQNFANEVRVDLDNVDFSVFGGTLKAEGLRVYDPEALGGTKLLDVKHFSVEVGLLDVLAGRFEIAKAVVDGLYIAPAPLLAAYEGKPEERPRTIELESIQLPETLGETAGKLNEFIQRQEVRDILDAYDLYQKHYKNKQADDLGGGETSELPPPQVENEPAKESAPPSASPVKRRMPAYVEYEIEKAHGPLFVVNEISVSNVEVSFKGVRREEEKPSHYLGTGIEIRNVSSDNARLGLDIEVLGSFRLDTSEGKAIFIDAILAPQAKVGQPLLELRAHPEGFGGLRWFKGVTSTAPRLSFQLISEGNEKYTKRVDIVMPHQGALGSGQIQASALYSDAGDIGLALEVENLPASTIVGDLKTSAFGVSESATISFKTIGAKKGFIIFEGQGTPTMLFELKARGLELTPKAGQKVLGLTSEDFCKYFNVVAAGEGELKMRFGYIADKGFELQSPTPRALMDSIINLVSLDAEDLNGEGITFGGSGQVTLESVDTEGVKRSLNHQPAGETGLGNIRVAVRVGEIQVINASKPVLGIPAATFKDAWNRATADGGLKGILGFRLTNEAGELAPELETGSFKPLIYAIVGGFRFNSSQYGNLFGGANFESSSGADKGSPVFALQAPSDWQADSLQPAEQASGLENLTLAAQWQNPLLSPEKQPKNILGLPSSQVVYVWNNFVQSQGGEIKVDFQLFDDKGGFSPSPKLDFKSMFSEAASNQGVEGMLTNPDAFLDLLGKDEGKRGEYQKYLKEAQSIAPDFGKDDEQAIAKKLGKAVEDIGKKIIPDKLPKFPGR
ncbi:MAG: hypothetical protein KDB07_05565 [Planctomycetes bacterium]|nr:hypothetical protein [Planctomycetota bacterium]